MNLRVFAFFALLSTGLALSLEKGRRPKKVCVNESKTKSKTDENKLKTTEEAEQTDDEPECSICLEGFQADGEQRSKRKVVRFQQCGHFFHGECIDRWFTENTSCPMCRRDVLDIFRFDDIDEMQTFTKSKSLKNRLRRALSLFILRLRRALRRVSRGRRQFGRGLRRAWRRFRKAMYTIGTVLSCCLLALLLLPVGIVVSVFKACLGEID